MGDSRNERMGERREGRRTMSARSAPPLEPKTAALVRIAAAIAAGKTAELGARFGAARGAGVPVLWIEELLLQSLLVVGYPLALVAFAVLGTAPQQLDSHLRGALNTGATAAEVEGVLALVESDLDPERLRRAREQWADVKRRKL